MRGGNLKQQLKERKSCFARSVCETFRPRVFACLSKYACVVAVTPFQTHSSQETNDGNSENTPCRVQSVNLYNCSAINLP